MRTKTIVVIVAVAVIFGTIGFFVGKGVGSGNFLSNHAAENKIAYQRGWSHWFSGYGFNGAGMQYIDYYTEGRKYNATFENVREAFYAGYKDGFYFVNHTEYSLDEERIEDGYLEYYPQ